MTVPVLDAVERTKLALGQNADSHWILGFSGGKDSTALLKILAAALNSADRFPRRIDVIYCDTGVENPVLDRYVKSLFGRLSAEFKKLGSPLQTTVLRAPVSDRFFVKVAGRGYPTPTNSFRWCTKNLRINPVSKFIAAAAREDAIVSLGMRRSESGQRDRSITANGGGYWQSQKEASHRYRLFLPILDFSVSDVWDTVFMFGHPRSVTPKVLEELYWNASGECPIIKSPQAAPCASGRFGCWTCTVVRRDKSAEGLIKAGHSSLKPFLEFRNWLSVIRNDPTRRWSHRRSGVQLPGPFNLKARYEILKKLRDLENMTGSVIVDNDERKEIYRLWRLDQNIDQSIDVDVAIEKCAEQRFV